MANVGTDHEVIELMSAIFGGRYDSGWRGFTEVFGLVVCGENKMFTHQAGCLGLVCLNCWHFSSV